LRGGEQIGGGLEREQVLANRRGEDDTGHDSVTFLVNDATVTRLLGSRLTQRPPDRGVETSNEA
ncbi:hypothetical protein, partial [Bradyrhizobium genomosp. I (2014)]|uniref:hypothetical protein n=1 Tax=Bradyrhizobium genomosp. I (2014) TaxID=2683269 RepID=UPI001AEC3CA2